MKAGAAWQDNDLIFCQAGGRPWNPDHVSKRFKKLAEHYGPKSRGDLGLACRTRECIMQSMMII